MLHRSERILDNIPVGSLGIIAVDGCEEMGNKVNDYLVKWRKEETRFQKDNLVFNGYESELSDQLQKYRVLDLVKPKVLSMSLYVEKTFI